jgi:hypothetical protein
MWVFSLVEGNRDEDGKHLLLDDVISEAVDHLAVHSTNSRLFMKVLVGTGDNQLLEHEHSLDFDEGVDAVVHDALNDWNHGWVANVSEGGKVNYLPVHEFVGVLLVDNILQFLDKVVEEFIFDKFLIAEVAINLDGVASSSDVGVHASLVEES